MTYTLKQITTETGFISTRQWIPAEGKSKVNAGEFWLKVAMSPCLTSSKYWVASQEALAVIVSQDSLAGLMTAYLRWSKRIWGFPGGTVVKNPPANAGDTGDMGSIPGSERSFGGRNGTPLQYSCLGNPIDRGAWAWRAIVHEVAKSQTRLSDWAHT